MENDPEASGATVPRIHPGSDQAITSPNRKPIFRRAIQVGVALGVASGVAVGAAALADAATSPSTPTTPSTTKPATPPVPGHFKGRGSGGFGFPGSAVGGIGFGGFGQVLHGEATVKGPNGYETVEVQTGTVTSVKDTAGTTWSIVITSADKTPLTYTVDAGTSVNGGETGISAVKTGDEVSIVAVTSKGTATAKTLIDMTRLQANRSSWMPPRQMPPSGSSAPSGTSTS